MLPSFATQTVIVRFPTVSADPRRNPELGWSPPAAVHTIDGCLLQPGASQEVLGGRDVTSSVWSLYLPAGSPIDASCQVEVDGVLYAVDGDPQRWTPTAANHVLAVLKAWR